MINPYMYGPAGYMTALPLAVQLVSDLTQAKMQAASSVVGAVATAVTNYSNALFSPWPNTSFYAQPANWGTAGRPRHAGYAVNIGPYARNFGPVNLTEGDDSYLAHVELPNTDPADISIRVGNRIEVSVKKQNDSSVDQITTIPMPDGVDSERVSADYKDGILTLRLPKEAKWIRREVKVRTSSGAAAMPKS